MYGPMTSPDADGEGLELYGNSSSCRGSSARRADRAHGHAIYSQNFQGKKFIHDNLVFNGFSWGVHCYAENVQKYVIDGSILANVTFNTNAAQTGPIVAGNDFLVGGDQVCMQPTSLSVTTSRGRTVLQQREVRLWHHAEQEHRIESNHFAGGLRSGCGRVTMHGNTIYGTSTGFDAASYPGPTPT